MKSKKFLIVILIIGVCMLLTGCKLTDHKLMEEIAAEYPYEVTLDFNGGLVNNYDYIKYRCKSGTKVAAPFGTLSPENYGYELIGWYLKPSADSDVSDIANWEEWNFASDTVTESITLVAKWRRLRSFSFGYYDDVVPEEGGDAVKTWIEIRNVSRGVDGTEFKCGSVNKDIYTSMNGNLSNKTLLSGFNSEQPFYADEALSQEIDLDTLVHPIVDEDDLDEETDNSVYRIYCKLLEGEWILLDSSESVSLQNRNYYLLGDVKLKSSLMTDYGDPNLNQGTYSNAVTRFSGTIKGNGYKIICEAPILPFSTRPSSAYIGFFGVLDGATIEDVTFEGISIKLALPTGTNSNLRFGFLAGNIINSTLKNVTVSGSLTIEDTAGNNSVRELVNDDVWFGEKDAATVVDECNFNIAVDDKRPSNS